MPMLMLQCKTCSFSTEDFKAIATNADTSHICSRRHTNEYVTADYMDWS
jgi:hypothetical protein